MTEARAITPLSDRAVLIRTEGPEDARRLAAALGRPAGWQDVVPGLDSVTVLFDPLRVTIRDVCKQIEASGPISTRKAPSETWPPAIIRVHYGGEDGPDFEALCRQKGLSAEEFIGRHTQPTYQVAMMGFLPGFAYLSGLDPALAASRLASPRLKVPAGSVGIGGDLGGIYSLAGSGGWAIIGRTELRLFDPDAEDPFLLHPGQSVRFEPA